MIGLDGKPGWNASGIEANFAAASQYGAEGTRVATNDNWNADLGPGMQITASGLQPQNNAASGIITDLAPGLHTAIVAGKRETTGVGLVKVYRL